MNKVAGYDLDGVLVSDAFWDKETIRLRRLLKPLFIPESDFVIITGRPVEDNVGALAYWVKSSFNTNIKHLYCANADWKKAAEYKASVLLTHPEIYIYFESDPEQVKIISALVSTPIFLWSDFLKAKVNEFTKQFIVGEHK